MDTLLSFAPEPFPELDREPADYEFDPLAGESETEEEDEKARGRRRPRISRNASHRYFKKLVPVRGAMQQIPALRAKPLARPPKLVPRPLPVPAFRPVPIPFVPPLLVPSPDLPPAAHQDVPRADDYRGTDQAGPAASGTPPAAEPSSEPVSEHVRWIQDCLNRALGLNLRIDGMMGRETRSAVRMFQERRGLSINGLAGPETEEALKTACAPTSATTPTQRVARRATNESEMMQANSCPSNLCNRRTDLNYELSFSPEPLGGTREFQESDTLELEALDPWHGVTGLKRNISYARGAEQEYPQKPTLRRGSRGPAVTELQRRLTVSGFPLQADGIFGPKTYQAVVGYQRTRGLIVDGIVGPQTWKALLGGNGPGPLTATCNPYQVAFERAALYVGVPISWATNSALCQLVRHESAWNPSAKNPRSTAFGLFQFLKSTWGTQLPEVPYGNTDPYWQAVGGFRYIRAAYRTPERAWAFWQATVRRNPALAPPDLRRKAEQWISKGWGGYEI